MIFFQESVYETFSILLKLWYWQIDTSHDAYYEQQWEELEKRLKLVGEFFNDNIFVIT